MELVSFLNFKIEPNVLLTNILNSATKMVENSDFPSVIPIMPTTWLREMKAKIIDSQTRHAAIHSWSLPPFLLLPFFHHEP